MKIQYFGKEFKGKGKTLWEILGNLKNYGVGRLVIEDSFHKYPEPSFYKILKVQPVDAPLKLEEIRKTMVWAEFIFRGRKHPNVQFLHETSWLTYFQLVPKSEEYKYANYTDELEERKVPKFIKWPPTLKEVLAAEFKKEGKELTILPSVIPPNPAVKFIPIEEEQLQLKPNLYMLDRPVEEVVKEIRHLKEVIKSASESKS